MGQDLVRHYGIFVEHPGVGFRWMSLCPTHRFDGGELTQNPEHVECLECLRIMREIEPRFEIWQV